MLHFPEKGRMTGYMTGQDPSVMTYEVMEVDAANRVLDVEVTGDVDFSGKVTFQEDDKIMVTRNEEKGAIIVRRIGKEAFEKLRGEPEG